jgi:hypothetical protein
MRFWEFDIAEHTNRFEGFFGGLLRLKTQVFQKDAILETRLCQ